MTKIKDAHITKELDNELHKILIENGFNGFYNRYCAGSYFWKKDVDNISYYVRVDFDMFYKTSVFSYEAWTRDNSKFNIKNINSADVSYGRFFKPKQIPKLIDFIESVSNRKHKQTISEAS